MEKQLTKCKFSIDLFKHNQAQFKFYNGFESYELFRVVLDYLEPAASSLLYWGANMNINSTTSENVAKRGRARRMNGEEEFFMVLVRLRHAFPLEDMAVRFNMSSSHLTHIMITWFDFLYCQFRTLPIWASKESVQKTMPKCFREEYPLTRVILDCTELY